MRFLKSISVLLPLLCASIAASFPAQQALGQDNQIEASGNHNISIQLFAELEEFARIVDIAYCVGVTGIYPPFECASRCSEFPGYQLVDTWNTGPLMADSCGYIALDHNGSGRIIVAFRGTYSVANTIMDLSTIPQEYVPYPSDPDEHRDKRHSYLPLLPNPFRWLKNKSSRSNTKSPLTNDDDEKPEGPKCTNCTVHMGFFASWTTTRPFILPHLRRLHDLYPTYALHLVGHSLGGAVAALAALECEAKGWHPTVTTFGEPRVGNAGLRNYLDEMFNLRHAASNQSSKGKFERESASAETGNAGRYRRLTHTSDPVPLLPLTEWSFAMHAGEIYISKSELQPGLSDLRLCDGDEDLHCIYGEEMREPLPDPGTPAQEVDMEAKWGLPARYKMWQLFFAHRDYFWRLGLCVPGGDPADWGRRYDNLTDGKRGQLKEL